MAFHEPLSLHFMNHWPLYQQNAEMWGVHRKSAARLVCSWQSQSSYLWEFCILLKEDESQKLYRICTSSVDRYLIDSKSGCCSRSIPVVMGLDLDSSERGFSFTFRSPRPSDLPCTVLWHANDTPGTAPTSSVREGRWSRHVCHRDRAHDRSNTELLDAS